MARTLSREPRRSRAFWLDHVERWKHSALSKAEYCFQNDLRPGSFYNWSRPNAIGDGVQPGSEPLSESESTQALTFIPVTLSEPVSHNVQCVHVERAATTVALPADLSPEQMEHWLSAIHRLHV